MSAGGFNSDQDTGFLGAGSNPTGSPNYNTKLKTDKAFQLATLLNILGIGSPDAQHSYAGTGIVNNAGALLPSWLETQGMDGGNVMDNVYGQLQDFGKKFTSPGGFGALAGDARSAQQKFQGNPALTTNLDDTQIMGKLKMLQELIGLPQSSIYQQARGNAVDSSFQQFLSQMGDTWRNQGDAAATGQRYLPFLRNNPQFKWALGQ